MRENINSIISLVCLGIMIWFMFRTCKSDSQTGETTRRIDTIYLASKDTYHEIESKPSKPVYVTNNYTVEAAKGPIDTGSVLRDYFSRRGYNDTIRNDSIDIILAEEVYKNELKRIRVAYKWKAPERLIRETITKYPNTLHIGVAFNFYNKVPSLGIYGGYETKRIGLGIIIDPFQRGGSIIITKKIKLGGWQK